MGAVDDEDVKRNNVACQRDHRRRLTGCRFPMTETDLNNIEALQIAALIPVEKMIPERGSLRQGGSYNFSCIGTLHKQRCRQEVFQRMSDDRGSRQGAIRRGAAI